MQNAHNMLMKKKLIYLVLILFLATFRSKPRHKPVSCKFLA